MRMEARGICYHLPLCGISRRVGVDAAESEVSQTTLEAKFNVNLNASAPVIGTGTNDHYTKCWILI